jgi:septal ring factor EnvC (AmiA/AmiB activator)
VRRGIRIGVVGSYGERGVPVVYTTLRRQEDRLALSRSNPLPVLA